MSTAVFTDKSRPPLSEELAAAVGPQWTAWEELVRFVTSTYRVEEEWKYYGSKSGWTLRYRKGGKALLSLTPAEGLFHAQVVLGEAHVEPARALPLGENVRRILESARPYPDGRWLFIQVASEQELRDVQQLVALKAGPPRRAKQARPTS